MKKKIDLSVIVTAHNEGLVAHKTMRSLFDAVQRLEDEGFLCEFVVHIDNGDLETKRYFRRYKNRRNFRIFENNFGDTGPSRNFAISHALGEYVGVFDGDDLITDNWFIEAIRLLKQTESEVVVHPESILTFGIDQRNVLTVQTSYGGSDKDLVGLIGENRWCSVLVAKRSTMLKVPYRKMLDGFGHEDYVFNIETIEKGISHIIAKETVLFYRRSNNSRLSLGNEERVTIPYMNIFSFPNFKKIVKPAKQTSRKKIIISKGYRLYKKIRNNPRINYFITPVAKVVIKVLNYESPQAKRKTIPKYVVEEWKKMNRIDSQLYPYKAAVNGVLFYNAEEQIDVGNAFLKIAESITGEPDYVFLVPWVVRGGADKVLFNYIEAIKENNRNAHFVVIATLNAKNTWAKNLPEYVDFVDFGKVSEGLSPEKADNLFTRLIVQLNCKNLHIINSEYAYDWVRSHKGLVKNNYNLTVSLFAWEYISGSNMKAVYSYDNPCLFEIYDVVKRVFTDNQAMIDYSIEMNGFSADKFKIHRQPVRGLKLVKPKKGLCERGKMKILWASRVVPLKLPELVVEIGKYLDEGSVQIDMYGELGENVGSSIFSGAKNVRYCGGYDGFDSLPIGEYDLFLYTSLSDGMPNVLLEAAAAGLPIVASDDGGVGEFVRNETTGYLVRDYTRYEEYVKIINSIMKDSSKLELYAKNAQNLLTREYTWDRFVGVVKRDMIDGEK